MPGRFVVVALGEVPRGVLPAIAAALKAVYGPPAVLGAAQPPPAYAFNKSRNQYHSAAVLRRLVATRGHDGADPVLGVTDVDLFVPDAPFVFGEADREAGTAVVSVARLAHGPDGRTADPERLRRRAVAESVHEIGHLLGLSHCPDSRCAMFLSHRPSDSDRKGPGLCAACRSALGLGQA
jgi:archaemetzincin